MNNHRVKTRLISYLVVLASMVFVGSLAYAGGPLVMVNGSPVRWARNEVRGGALNSQTVDASGRVLYRVDSGKLGTLSEEEATILVDRIFKSYTDIPTANIEFVNAGRILDPGTRNPVNVTGSNAGRFLSSSSPTFQNPIIFDNDGSITGGGGVLGFFGFLQADQFNATIREGFVVLNGAALKGSDALTTTSFLGVFTHEFGHFAGPLDHSQINGNIALNGSGSILPQGFSREQAYDLYAPFTETLFPFLFNAPLNAQLSGQFEDSGYFVATLDMDTQNALSNLYPTPDYLASRGSIEGRVLLKYGSSAVPISGINVIARRVDQGQYPPSTTTLAFPLAPTIDGDGVPQIPSAQSATDPLATAASAVTGLEFGAGTYRIQGLPPGQYMVQIQQINPNATGGSGIGPLGSQFTLPIKEEFFNGPNDSSNLSGTFVPVTVTAGGIAGGTDFVINGISTLAPAPVNESEPNSKKKQAQQINSIPADISAVAADGDSAELKMTLPGGVTDKVEDLYEITVTASRIVYVLLEPTSGAGDLDMYLYDSSVKKKKSSLNDSHLLGFSSGPTANELIAVQLVPGTYFIGVSAFEGSVNYRMRIFTSQ